MGKFNTSSDETDLLRPISAREFPDLAYERIGGLLLEQRGFDLGKYKDRCLKRRIASRIRGRGCASAASYLELLAADPGELDALVRTLTIHVSQFFRNPTTFKILQRRVLPHLFRRASLQGRGARLFSFGCSTGEETYSLALAALSLPGAAEDFTVEGLDISPDVLEKARSGLYHPMRLKEVSALMLRNAFIAEAGLFRLKEDIRKRVRFSCRDLLDEAPFAPSDLILCRNMLIYFSRSEQDRLLRRIADCLGPGGYLVLGRAESLMGEIRGRFVPEFPEERIFRCL